VAPSLILNDGWEDDYIIELPSGFIVAMPYMLGDRSQQLQSLLDRVAQRNTDGRPVVMMGHLAVTGSDITGHDFEIGTLKTQSLASLGSGYDYLALGHIHKPQTLGHPEDSMNMEAITYPAPVARYSGSALHVSCDETYPHTVSVIDIDHHGGQVTVRQLRIDELRHFYTLPEDPNAAFADENEALEGVKTFCQTVGRGYIRLKVHYSADLSANFAQKVYDIMESRGNEVRYNPKTLWIGEPEKSQDEVKQTFELAELQQMTDPMVFIEKTKDQYPYFDIEELRSVFDEIKSEAKRLMEDNENKQKKANKGKISKSNEKIEEI
jgi:exonuclease SbcD